VAFEAFLIQSRKREDCAWCMPAINLIRSIYNLTMETILQASIVVICIGVIQWLLSIWIKNRLEHSIRNEYDKQLEEYKFSISKRDKIANIASFFSLWIKYRGCESVWLSENELIEYYQELTKMSFEIALWIDDEILLKDVMNRLKNKDGSASTVELLLKVKKLISENKQSILKPEDITIWPADFKFIKDK
jgi:hypothetical protein